MISINGRSIIKVVIPVILFGISVSVRSQHLSGEYNNASQNWTKISHFFSPPAKYQDEYGEYRSPLIMNDGTPVDRPAKWKERRREILDYWHGVMGEWPPFIRHQKMQILETSVNEGIIQHKIRFLLLPGQYTEGYLLVPAGKGKRPAVITVYYEPETAIGKGKSPYRDFAYQLALRGFLTLSLGTAETTASKTYSLYYPDITCSEIQPLSVLAYAAANAWFLLSDYRGVDDKRIGLVGHSYGGKWAMFGSCLFDRFACAVWSDPGIVFDESRPNVNYWEPWYLGYYPPPWKNTWRKTGIVEDAGGVYPQLIREGHDLHELHALMAPRPFLVSGGSEDTPARWPALNHSIAVNELLGYRNRVAMTNRPAHSPDSVSNEAIYAFFEYFLMNKKIK
ncbi:MAG TPA: sialidase [Bacteroidales bacterium]|nr:sialidase [Bacteroidales bacterium]HPF04076.1 sialidase [Bacteroidales bacterium]HPJ58498.1 sialidase [Bacteroidales bacterium]HPR11673.1 sialidase [Bacteroidales bacterium]HRW85033.1 sialidase [Bacteroidales bacterium]